MSRSQKRPERASLFRAPLALTIAASSRCILSSHHVRSPSLCTAIRHLSTPTSSSRSTYPPPRCPIRSLPHQGPPPLHCRPRRFAWRSSRRSCPLSRRQGWTRWTLRTTNWPSRMRAILSEGRWRHWQEQSGSSGLSSPSEKVRCVGSSRVSPGASRSRSSTTGTTAAVRLPTFPLLERR